MNICFKCLESNREVFELVREIGFNNNVIDEHSFMDRCDTCKPKMAKKCLKTHLIASQKAIDLENLIKKLLQSKS